MKLDKSKMVYCVYDNEVQHIAVVCETFEQAYEWLDSRRRNSYSTYVLSDDKSELLNMYGQIAMEIQVVNYETKSKMVESHHKTVQQ